MVGAELGGWVAASTELQATCRPCFSFLPSCASAGLSAPSSTACFINERPLVEVRPGPTRATCPALAAGQHPPTPRAQSPGFGNQGACAPPRAGALTGHK